MNARVVSVRATQRVVFREVRYRCSYCSKPYGTLAGVAGHLVNHHAGEVIPTEYAMRALAEAVESFDRASRIS